MEKKLYQEPAIRVIKISNDLIATSGDQTDIEDWGTAGGGSGSFGENVNP